PGDDSGRARSGRRARKRRIGDRHGEAVSKPLAQRNCQREAGKARATNQDIDSLTTLGHAFDPRIPYDYSMVRPRYRPCRRIWQNGSMSSAIQDLLAILDLEQLEMN